MYFWIFSTWIKKFEIIWWVLEVVDGYLKLPVSVIIPTYKYWKFVCLYIYLNSLNLLFHILLQLYTSTDKKKQYQQYPHQDLQDQLEFFLDDLIVFEMVEFCKYYQNLKEIQCQYYQLIFWIFFIIFVYYNIFIWQYISKILDNHLNNNIYTI